MAELAWHEFQALDVGPQSEVGQAVSRLEIAVADNEKGQPLLLGESICGMAPELLNALKVSAP